MVMRFRAQDPPQVGFGLDDNHGRYARARGRAGPVAGRMSVVVHDIMLTSRPSGGGKELARARQRGITTRIAECKPALTRRSRKLRPETGFVQNA
jgi:hypothetical protein